MVKRAIVVDDSVTMRIGVRNMLAKIGFSVVAEGRNGQEAVALAEKHQPELLMLDINMPGMTGVEAIPLILSKSPKTKVIMMTSVSDEQSVDECLSRGAVNYMLKDPPHEEITQAILETMEA